MPYFLSCANLTLYVTTPMKYTTTTFLHSIFTRGITTPTTHEVTTLNSYGCSIALSPLSSFEIYRCVFITERRRVFKINKIPPTRRLMIKVYWLETKLISSKFSFSFLLLPSYTSIIIFKNR